MRLSTLLGYLLVMHLLLHGAYGARFRVFDVKPARTQNSNSENNGIAKKFGDNNISGSRGGDIKAVCRDGAHCASKGNIVRKYITSSIVSSPITKSIQENLDGAKQVVDHKRGDDKNENNVSSPIQSPSTVTIHNDKHHKVAPKKYEDVIDMTEMDYSPAKRKPPIHN